jgi:7-cyano-7-deazaguanine reductase
MIDRAHEAPESTEFERRYDLDGEDEIAAHCLRTCEIKDRPQQEMCVALHNHEFTSVCPWSGLPDFGTIVIRYVPDKLLVEQKSLKYYLLSFRNVGLLQEEAVQRIECDLRALLAPQWLTVSGHFNARGGISTHVTIGDEGEWQPAIDPDQD